LRRNSSRRKKKGETYSYLNSTRGVAAVKEAAELLGEKCQPSENEEFAGAEEHSFASGTAVEDELWNKVRVRSGLLRKLEKGSHHRRFDRTSKSWGKGKNFRTLWPEEEMRPPMRSRSHRERGGEMRGW